MMLEDDVRLDEDWLWWVERWRAEMPTRVVYGYMSYPKAHSEEIRASVAAGCVPRRAFEGVISPLGAWGAQCVLLPAAFLDLLWNGTNNNAVARGVTGAPLHAGPEYDYPIDALIQQMHGVSNSRQQPFIAVPNFVQHLQLKCVLDVVRPTHSSFTHGLPVCGGENGA